MNKNFMYGIGAVKYKDFTIGYIEKNSFDLGGKKPEAAKIEAEQVQGAPVLVIPQSNGGIAPTFNVIQMNYSNLHKLLGGSLHYKKEDLEKKTPIGWTAPSEVLVMQGPWELSLVSGQSVLIPNATLLSNPAGKLTLTETSKIEVTLEVAMPEDGSQPYGVFDTEAIPDLLAYTVCRGYVSRHVGIGVTAWVLRNFVEWRYLTAMFQTFERLMGTKDFMRIISSTARANPMTPRLSQARKGS